jgi:hypothetical protein
MTMRCARAALAAALLTAICGSVFAQGRSPQSTIRDMEWLAGDWVGTSGDRTFEERWTPPAGGAMLAVSRTLRNDRMMEFEFLRIVERDGRLVYVAQPGGQPPTDFPMTSLSNRVATFENRSHDFPKVIQYALRPEGVLEAIVGDGAQKKITYTYRKR